MTKENKSNQTESLDLEELKPQEKENSLDSSCELNEVEETDIQKDNVETDDFSILKKELEEKNKEISQYKENYLLAKAEADNVRKRAEKEVSNARKYALDKFIPELLSVKDTLELGVKAATEKEDKENAQLTDFVKGSEMAIGMFMETLKKVGVEIVDPKDEAFNPEYHQAVTMVPNGELPVNTIIDVIQKGYLLNERLVRPAMVIVSKEP